MGMFDSFYTADGVEWQTKAYECVLAEWGVGDPVPDGECVRTYQVKVLGGRRDTSRYSFVTIRDLVVAGIDVPRDPLLPLVDYCGGVAEMPTQCLDGQPKLRYDLIPEPALAAMAHAFTVGTKHGDGIKVESFATEYAAIMRHLEACRRGETVDPDDGHLHLGAVMARCAKLIATGTKWEGE